MKLGTENRTTTIVAVALFALAIFLFARMWIGGHASAATASVPQNTAITSAPAPAPAAGPRAGRAGRSPGLRNAASAPVNPLDPRLRLDLLKHSEDVDYKGSGRNIFRAEVDIPKPVVSPVKQETKAVPQLPPGPPPPPPINLKFFGFATSTGEPTKVFLGNGDDVFVAGVGEIVNRRYKVMKINRNSVEIEDVLSNNRQTIPLTAG